MLESHIGILVMFFFAAAVSVIFILLAETLGVHKTSPAKEMTYECGMKPFEAPSGRHSVRFYLVGMLFVIFDIELVFLFPWAAVFRELRWSAFWAMMVFLGIFEIGFFYAWRKGAFQWR